MQFYQIREILTPCKGAEIRNPDCQYAVVLNLAEWRKLNESFDMTIDLDMDPEDPLETKAVVNYDSLTGTFSVPDRSDIAGSWHRFGFALDEKGIIFIDDEGFAAQLIEEIRRTKKWRLPSLERFLYDFLEMIIGPDLRLLENMENRLTQIEEIILKENGERFPKELNDIRGDLLDLRAHYEQMIDLGQELEENENGFFRPENLRFFRMFTERVIRLQDRVTFLREYVVQLRDLVQSQLSVKQNHIMTLLTVITSIFMPLTLIAGWYGMNFRYMPELEWKWAYPAVIIISVLIVVLCLLWFKRKKWM